MDKYTKNSVTRFYSNYYSETTYDGYAADTQEGARTKGDAVLSISPSEKNRYYIFQKHLKLYKYAYIVDDNGNVHKENNPLLFEGAIFDGEFKGQTVNDNPNETAKNEITQAFNEGKLKKGDLIVLDGDVVKYGTNPSSDEFYYFVVDYYMPTTGGNGKQVQYAVARMGSEFGSGIVEHEGTKLPKGDFLSWYDQSGQNSEVYNYDDTIPASKLSSGDWILVTKIGGLRIGDLHQNIQLKTENKTNTSKSYYLPIIADDSSTEGSDAIFNVYLGNNGLLTYSKDRFELPLAGGIGVVIIYVIGISLIIGSIIYFKTKYSKKSTKRNKTGSL